MLPKALMDLLDGDDCDCDSCGVPQSFLDLTKEEAQRLISLSPNPYNCKVGDIVERSTEGRKACKFPADGTNQLVKVEVIYDTYREHNNTVNMCYNAIVSVAIEEGVLKTFAADLRHYQPVTNQ